MTKYSHGKFVSSMEEEKHEPPAEEQHESPQDEQDEPTEPHPATGVHEVHVRHHGGHATTHTHHDGGRVEKKHHANLAEAHAHAKKMLPDDGEEQAQESAPDMSGAMSGLDGGTSY